MRVSRLSVCGWALCAATAVAGCSRTAANMGSVSGKVTLDGQPLAGARVTFTPVEGGSPSIGLTDAQGSYTLSFSRGIQGALLGEHEVAISTYSAGDPDAEPPLEGTPEKVPAHYNLQTQLRAQVEKGSNTINFDLISGSAGVARNAP